VIVLDSSFLVAYHNRRDVHHDAASAVMRQIVGGEWGRALLLEYVFVEVVTVLLARRGLSSASEAATTLLEADEVEFVPCPSSSSRASRPFAVSREHC
jgi:predicted nucleic acid-binding protein